MASSVEQQRAYLAEVLATWRSGFTGAQGGAMDLARHRLAFLPRLLGTAGHQVAGPARRGRAH